MSVRLDAPGRNRLSLGVLNLPILSCRFDKGTLVSSARRTTHSDMMRKMGIVICAFLFADIYTHTNSGHLASTCFAATKKTWSINLPLIFNSGSTPHQQAMYDFLLNALPHIQFQVQVHFCLQEPSLPSALQLISAASALVMLNVE